MKAVFDMELIGDDLVSYLQAKRRGKLTRPRSPEAEARWLRGQERVIYPWVARIVGRDEHYGLAREFVKVHKDYTTANGTGSRGVRGYYLLDDGYYEVNERTSWRKTSRYFIRVQDTEITEVGREEVEDWLNATSASAS